MGPETRKASRHAGAIEQDADVVMMLWRPEYYFDDRTPMETVAKLQGMGELLVAKQRDGETGTVRLTWQKQWTTFVEQDTAAGGYQ